MAEENRKIRIDIEADYSSLEKVKEKIESLEKDKVTVNCELDIDGKSLKTDLEDALKKLSKGGLTQKVALELDTNALYKELNAIESAAKKTADTIAKEFDRATTANKPSSLRKMLNGKQTFSRDNEKAIKELISYRNAAMEKVKSIEFDFSNLTGGMDEARVHAYGKALSNLITVLNDVDSVASKRGLVLPDFSNGLNIDAAVKKLNGLKSSASNLIQTYSKGQTESLRRQLEDIESTFLKLSKLFGKTSGFGSQEIVSVEQINTAIALLKELKNQLQDISSAVGTVSSNTELQPLVSSIHNISEALTSLKSVIVDVGDGQEFSPLLSTINSVVASIQELKSSISGLKMNLNVDLGFGTDEKTLMKVESRKQELLSAYRSQFEALKNYEVENSKVVSSIFSKMNNPLIAEVNKSVQLFDESAFDNIDQKISAYETIISKMKEINRLQYGDDVYANMDTRYQKTVTQAKANLTRSINSISAGKSFDNLFGGDSLAKLVGQLDQATAQIQKVLQPVEVGSEVTDLSQMQNVLQSIVQAVNEKTQAFKNEGSIVSSVIDQELTALGTLWGTIDDVTQAANQMFSVVPEGSSSLRQIADSAKVLDGIKFSGLSKLKGIQGVVKSSVTLSDSFVKTQGSRLNSALQQGRNAGLSENDLSELSHLSDLLQKRFNPSNIGNFGDLNGEMGTYIELLNSAIHKSEQLVAAKNAEKQAQELNNQALKSYSSYLSERSKLIGQIGGKNWDNQSLERVKQLTSAMDEIGQQNQNNALFDNVHKLAQAQVQDITDAYSQMLASISSDIDSFQKKIAGTNLQDNTVYQSWMKDVKAFNSIKASFDETGYFDFDEMKQAMDYSVQIQNGTKALQQQITNISKIQSISDKIGQKFKGFTENDFVNGNVFNEISEKMKEIQSLSAKGIIDETDVSRAKELGDEISDLSKTLNAKVTNKGTYIGEISGGATKEGIEQLKTLIRVQEQAKGSKKIDFGIRKNDYSGLEYSVVTKNGELQKYSATIDKANNSARTLMKTEGDYTTAGQQFINTLKGKFAELTRYITAIQVFQKVFQFLREGIAAVVDINSAMTELKKVTDETATSYENFKKQAGQTAVTVGGTTKDIISSTADYARLGYNLPDSSELAKNTAIYKNVGDGIDIATATEDIISITKAYEIAANKSMDVIDVLNEVGNNYAVSSSGLGEILKRSSSALAAANNTFEESVAMGTAMNEILQDTATTGTTLKMLSLRIRGRMMPPYKETYMYN